MIVAVAYDNGQIGEHFGHARMFALYDYKDTDVSSCTKRLIDSSDRHGHLAMAELMRDNGVDAVLSQNMGEEAVRIRRRIFSSTVSFPSAALRAAAAAAAAAPAADTTRARTAPAAAAATAAAE